MLLHHEIFDFMMKSPPNGGVSTQNTLFDDEIENLKSKILNFKFSISSSNHEKTADFMIKSTILS